MSISQGENMSSITNNNNDFGSAFTKIYFQGIQEATNVDFRGTESPITKTPMDDPVVDGDGHTYNRSDIEQRILNPTAPFEEQQYQCDFSHKKFKVKDLIPNRALRDLTAEIQNGEFKKIVVDIAEKQAKCS